MPFSTLARRYGLIIYWAAFAALTVRAGHDPGFAPSLTAYPWKGVALTVGQLAIAVAILYAILRPRTFRRSWGRLGTAFLYVLVLFAFTLAPTDMPGYYYVPGAFAMTTLLGLIVLALVMSASALQRG